jgi:hypothetical protein
VAACVLEAYLDGVPDDGVSDDVGGDVFDWLRDGASVHLQGTGCGHDGEVAAFGYVEVPRGCARTRPLSHRSDGNRGVDVHSAELVCLDDAGDAAAVLPAYLIG